MTANDTPDPPPGTYRVTFKSVGGDEVINRTFIAKAPDDACGLAADFIRKEQQLTVEEFNDRYRLVAVAAECVGGGLP